MDASVQRPSPPETAQGLSIWARLVLVVLAGVLPMGLLAGVVAWQLAQSARERQTESLLYSSRAVLSALDARLNQQIALAHALGAMGSVMEDDPTEFQARVDMAFPDRSESWVLLADAEGNQVLNCMSPAGTQLPSRHPEGLKTQRRAFDTRHVQISNLFNSCGNRWVVTVELPIFKDAQPFRSLAVVMRAEGLARLLNQQSLPEGWFAAIFDREGRIVARSHNNERFVGRYATQDWRDKITSIPQGLTRTVNLEGEAIIAAQATSAVSGWVVAVASTAAAFHAPLRDLMVWANGLGMAVTGFSIMLALWAASRISEPVRALERNAAALAAGHEADVRSRLPEVQRVWAAMTEAVADRARREAAVRESEQRFRNLADGAPVLIWVNGLDRTEFINRYYVEFVGVEFAPTSGEDARVHFLQFMHPDDRVRSLAAYKDAAARRAIFEAEFRLRRHDGEYRWLKAVGLPRIGPNGKFHGYVGSAFDITDIKAREQHVEFILHELSHRSKNLLAVVHAIARQTARQCDDVSEFGDRFSARVRALSDAHDLLVRHEWKGAPIRDVVAGQLLPFEGANVEMSGPDVTLRPEAVQNLVLAIHELATNATKHGALSVPEGKIAVRWEAYGKDADSARLRITWTESGGPAIAPPVRTGFGNIVLQRVTPTALSGTGTLDYPPTGLVWTLDIPATWLV